MKVFFACTGKTEPRYLCDAGHKNILCSYHYYLKDEETIKYLQENGVSLFADSGAFSAENSGKNINIDQYSKFIIRNDIKIFVSLDVIGDAEKTMENWLYMKNMYLLNPMPTFHTGEEKKYLLRYLEECEYIALGGMVGIGDLNPWLDDIWTLLLKTNPDIKIHGFGMTNTEIIYKYPWYSFDSSSFKSGKRFGRVPRFNGKKLYQISVHQFKTEYQKEKPDAHIFFNNPLFYKESDLSGAAAYRDMVEYLNKFDKRNEFMRQSTLF